MNRLYKFYRSKGVDHIEEYEVLESDLTESELALLENQYYYDFLKLPESIQVSILEKLNGRQ